MTVILFFNEPIELVPQGLRLVCLDLQQQLEVGMVEKMLLGHKKMGQADSLRGPIGPKKFFLWELFQELSQVVGLELAHMATDRTGPLLDL